WRCANALFNYCSGEPEWGKPPKPLGPGLYPTGGSCKLDPKTCGRHQTINQQLEGVVLPKGYHHTQTAKTKRRKKRK
ncbi:unnamed protein product, partial [marine sediment metagenome]